MKRLLSFILSAGLLAGMPGLPATQAFAQVVTGSMGAPIIIGGAAGAVTRAGVGPATMGQFPASIPGGTALIAPLMGSPTLMPRTGQPLSVSPRAVAGVQPASAGTVSGAGVHGVVGPESMSLALPLSRVAPGAVAFGTLEQGVAQRAPPGASGLRLLEAPRLEGAGVPSESKGLSLRSRENARFDGAIVQGETSTPTDPAVRNWAAPSFLSRAVDGGRAATPGPGALLPPAPGLVQPSAVPTTPTPIVSAPYRMPSSLKWPARIYMAAHGLSLVSAVVAVGVALGWAALASTAMVGGAVAWQWHRLGALPSDPRLGHLAPSEQDALQARVGGILESLVVRLGLQPSERPQVVLTNERGTENSIAVGNGIGSHAVIKVGEGLHFLPAPHVEGFLAHELGHLAHHDLTPGRYLRTRAAMDIGKGLFVRVAAWGAAIHAVPAVFSWLHGGFSLGLVSAAVGTSFAWLAAGYAAAVIGFLFGLAALRQQELRADHWAAWLAGPEGWASYLEAAWARVEGAARGLKASLRDRLLSEHPSYAERIRRLRGG